ncbi:uncharacterized protein LOC126894992 isoform X5 [Daktulosphaira vitifoliae]|uniref:uncharacterized protein LOC126894992 isoform X5 n=1 Tax=Daktulosphaira vitifoliae TaxID=58002 RepID=UPI0021AA00F4|nr:uncharacterized protein LOC126894992 isoform X5 [Daktulosphaira vitifoliae]
MNFYFCFGVLLCFMCLNTIPTFSIGSSSSIKKEPEEMPEKYPLSFYIKQFTLDNFFKISVENDEIIFKKRKYMKQKSQKYKSSLIKNKTNESDDELISTLREHFEKLTLDEINLNDLISKSDSRNKGTIPRNQAKIIFKKNDLFKNDENIENTFNKYKEDNDTFNYKKWIAEFCDVYEGDKSNFLTYDKNTRKWKKKYPKNTKYYWNVIKRNISIFNDSKIKN